MKSEIQDPVCDGSLNGGVRMRQRFGTRSMRRNCGRWTGSVGSDFISAFEFRASGSAS